MARVELTGGRLSGGTDEGDGIPRPDTNSASSGSGSKAALPSAAAAAPALATAATLGTAPPAPARAPVAPAAPAAPAAPTAPAPAAPATPVESPAPEPPPTPLVGAGPPASASRTDGGVMFSEPPLASRSAGLPARPRPSWPRRPRKSIASSSSSMARAPAAPIPVAHGGGAAQSRGGFRRGVDSTGPSGAGFEPRHSSAESPPASPGRAVDAAYPAAAAVAAPDVAAPRPGPASASPAARARADSRRAQSWNVGHTGNALERQYASWWARARGAGWTSA